MTHPRPFEARARHRLAIAAALLAAWLLAAGTAAAGYGHLEIHTPAGGRLEMTHSEGWTMRAWIDAPVTTLWDVPSGAYVLRLEPARERTGAAVAEGVCWVPDQMTLVLSAEADSTFRRLDAPAGARGALTHLEAGIWWALPGTKEQIAGGLDTRVRVRPSASIDGRDPGQATERRSILPGQQGALGELLLAQTALSPIPGAAAVRYGSAHPTQGRLPRVEGAGQPLPPYGTSPSAPTQAPAAYPVRPLRVALGVAQTSREGTQLEGQIGMARWPFLGLPGRGQVALRYADLNDASPRPEGGNVLPHNDANVLDLVGSVELGSPSHRTLWGAEEARGGAGAGGAGAGGAGAGGASRGGRDEPLSGGRYGLSIQVASRGWERNHFLQEYLYNLDHAPHEETALFDSRVAFSMKSGRSTLGELWLGYNRYVTWLGDGVHQEEIAGYLRASGEPNGGADETGLYWLGDDPENLTGAHVFDYYARKYTATYSAGLDLRQARGAHAQWGLTASARQYTYRRYEHFSPLTDFSVYDEDELGKALRIGYDKLGATIEDGAHGPGEAASGRVTVWDRRRVAPGWQLQLGLGAHYFACAESALVSLQDPRGADGVLSPEELREPDAVIDPEATLALRGRVGGGTDAWLLARRQVHQPPLEALFSPRAHLRTTSREGVIGNPELEPERETSLELGIGRQATIGGRHWRWQTSLYGTFLQDAISLGAVYLDDEQDPANAMPVYINDGELQQMGIHIEAASAMPDSPLWMRVSYDFSSTQTNYFEPPLLNQHWLYPDRPQGEFASEGYPGAAGGILDVLLTAGGDPSIASREMRPSNLDRPHRVSFALVHQGTPAPPQAPWYKQVVSGWDTGVLVRLESGRRYTQTYAYPAGLLPPAAESARGETDLAWAQVVEGALRNDEAADPTMTIDLAFTRRIAVGERSVRFSIEALNIPGIKNALSVYRATGKPDDDGCSASAGCSGQLPAEVDLETYLDRILDPRNYDRPFVVRAGVSVDIL